MTVQRSQDPPWGDMARKLARRMRAAATTIQSFRRRKMARLERQMRAAAKKRLIATAFQSVRRGARQGRGTHAQTKNAAGLLGS